jgi:hypothetical protein
MRHPRRKLTDGTQGFPAHELLLGGLQIVDDRLQASRRLLRLFEEARVVDGVADARHQRVQELQVDGAERLGVCLATVTPLCHVDDADDR